MLLDDLVHPVVREARELRGLVLVAEELDRRHRQRQHLLVAGPALHHADTLVEVPQHRDVHPALERGGEARIALGDALHPLEVRRGKDVGKDVELLLGFGHAQPYRM